MGQKFLVAGLALGLGGASASASLTPLYEPFNYTATEKLSSTTGGATPVYSGQTNLGADNAVGGGDDRTWAATGASTTDDPLIASGNLTMPAGMPAATGNSASYGGTGNGSRIATGGVVAADPAAYYSLVFSITNTSNLQLNSYTANSSNWLFSFNTVSGGQATIPSVGGTRVFARQGTTAGTFNIGVTRNSTVFADITWDTADIPINTSVFIVGKYDVVGSVGTDDISTIWINPTSLGGAEPAGGISSTGGADLSTGSIQSFLFKQTGIAGQPDTSVVVDELRLGTTFASVTPVSAPEPAGLAFGAVGMLSLLTRRRRTA